MQSSQLDALTEASLTDVAHEIGTPAYVYFPNRVEQTVASLRAAFGGRFALSYAVKCNPNRGLLRTVDALVEGFDVSSAGELERLHALGVAMERISFTGPAKREAELERALELGCGELVCESERELEQLDALAALRGLRQKVLLRINPASSPRSFGMRMAGRPTQFGIDEEEVEALLARVDRFPQLDLVGLHVYSATNSLDLDGLDENFAIMVELFERFAPRCPGKLAKLIFGSGFGIPYQAGQAPLDLESLAPRVNARIDAMRAKPGLADARCVLEMGRYLVGAHGYFISSVLGTKQSRGKAIALCDGGLHQHITACGLMGQVVRRNFPMWKLGVEGAAARAPLEEVMLTGPLCTTLDTIATRVELPRLACGDVIAIGSSGAYGLTLSPSAFIDHPLPAEVLVFEEGDARRIEDASAGGAG